MKRLLSLLAITLLGAAASAQATFNSTQVQRGFRTQPGKASNSAPPVTNPEPLTLVALAGGAAAAGGLLRRRKKAA